MEYKKNKIIAVDVFIDKRKSRVFVGRLSKTKQTNEAPAGYKFEYDAKYLYSTYPVSIGPELPLTQKVFFSNEMFESFADRIPSKDNPAYADYCMKFGIAPEEKDWFVLVSTIGSRGPSSFIFEPVPPEAHASGKEIKKYRKELGLTIREFCLLFDLSPFTLQKIEVQKQTGREILKRLTIYIHFPKVAMYEIKRNGRKIHSNSLKKVIKKIKEQVPANQHIPT